MECLGSLCHDAKTTLSRTGSARGARGAGGKHRGPEADVGVKTTEHKASLGLRACDGVFNPHGSERHVCENTHGWPCIQELTSKRNVQLFSSNIKFQLDYFISLLSDLSSFVIKPLQMIENSAARILFDLPKCSHSAALLQLWLPACPPHKEPKSKACWFSVLALMWWNKLLPSLRTAESLPAFKNGLKTHLLETNFSPVLLKPLH
ncbi:hypothetical protein Z043_106264, partial [Scleropages formosus]